MQRSGGSSGEESFPTRSVPERNRAELRQITKNSKNFATRISYLKFSEYTTPVFLSPVRPPRSDTRIPGPLSLPLSDIAFPQQQNVHIAASPRTQRSRYLKFFQLWDLNWEGNVSADRHHTEPEEDGVRTMDAPLRSSLTPAEEVAGRQVVRADRWRLTLSPAETDPTALSMCVAWMADEHDDAPDIQHDARKVPTTVDRVRAQRLGVFVAGG